MTLLRHPETGQSTYRAHLILIIFCGINDAIIDKYERRDIFFRTNQREGVMSESASDATTAKNLTILIGGLVLLTVAIAALVVLIVY